MINKGAEQKLTQYLRAAAPDYAILLRGAWGSGKSFFWEAFKRNHLTELHKTDITFSVAGLTTREELDQAMFLASVNDLGTPALREASGVLGRALLRFVKIEPNEIKLKAHPRPGESVICIDDVERFGGDFTVLFGFVVSLLDAAKLYVVLISDEEQATEKWCSYRRFKEKIISVTAELRPDIEAFYSDTANGIAHTLTREALLDIQDHAVTFFKEKGLKNLRTLRGILEEMKLIMCEMTWPKGQVASLSPLLSAVSFHVIAVTKDVSNEKVVREIFLQGDIGTAVMMSRANGKKKERSVGEEKAGAPVSDLIEGLGFDGDVYDWHGSKAFADYVIADGFAPDEIAKDFQVFAFAKEEGVSLLERFRSYRTMDEGEFRTCVAALEEKVAAGEFGDLGEIWQAYQILNHLAAERLIITSRSALRDQFVRLAQGFDATRDMSPSLEVWPEQYDSNETSVLTALKDLERRINVERTKGENVKALETLIEGRGDAPINEFGAPFADAIPEEIYARLSTGGRGSAQRMANFFRRRLRITNLRDFAEGDVQFAKALAALIESRRAPDTAPITLEDAQWLQLAGVLHQFANKFEPPAEAVAPPDSG